MKLLLAVQPGMYNFNFQEEIRNDGGDRTTNNVLLESIEEGVTFGLDLSKAPTTAPSEEDDEEKKADVEQNYLIILDPLEFIKSNPHCSQLATDKLIQDMVIKGDQASVQHHLLHQVRYMPMN